MGLPPVLELWVGVVGASTWLQTVVWSLSVIVTLNAAKRHELQRCLLRTCGLSIPNVWICEDLLAKHPLN